MEFDKDELKLLIHQFLAESDGEKYREALQMLARESRLFFDIKYFKECVSNGDWEEEEMYLSRFTNAEDNRESFSIFFEIRRQNYHEAHDKSDCKMMLDILKRDLEVFTLSQTDLYRGHVPLIQLNKFQCI